MFQVGFIFTILFVAFGPFRSIPYFYAFTHENDWPYRIRAAVYATLIAGALIAVVALTGVSTIQSWHVSIPALDIATGLLLARSTLQMLTKVGFENSSTLDHAQGKSVSALALALSPMAAPAIVTPTGIVTIILFLSLAQNGTVQNQIYGLLFLMLVLNLVGMLLAEFIMRYVKMTAIEVIGWLFAAMQAPLAVELILHGLKSAGFAAH